MHSIERCLLDYSISIKLFNAPLVLYWWVSCVWMKILLNVAGQFFSVEFLTMFIFWWCKKSSNFKILLCANWHMITKIVFELNPLGGVLWKKVFLKIFTKFTGKHQPQSFFFNKVAGLSFFTEHLCSGWLLLDIIGYIASI